MNQTTLWAIRGSKLVQHKSLFNNTDHTQPSSELLVRFTTPLGKKKQPAKEDYLNLGNLSAFMKLHVCDEKETLAFADSNNRFEPILF